MLPSIQLLHFATCETLLLCRCENDQMHLLKNKTELSTSKEVTSMTMYLGPQHALLHTEGIREEGRELPLFSRQQKNLTAQVLEESLYPLQMLLPFYSILSRLISFIFSFWHLSSPTQYFLVWTCVRFFPHPLSALDSQNYTNHTVQLTPVNELLTWDSLCHQSRPVFRPNRSSPEIFFKLRISIFF